jgi:hypothetical protein
MRHSASQSPRIEAKYPNNGVMKAAAFGHGGKKSHSESSCWRKSQNKNKAPDGTLANGNQMK